MELTKQVEETLKKPIETSEEQAAQISVAVKLVDELVKQGLMEPPKYRLAPTSVPAKVVAFSK